MPRPALFLMLATVALLPACGWRSEPVGDRADRFPVDVADASGATLVIQAAPRVIVSLDRGATRTLQELGYEGRVVDVDSADTDQAAEAGPDLIVAPLGLADEDVARLQTDVGVPVFRFGVVRFEDASAVVARLALAVGRGPEGVALATSLGDGVRDALARAQQAGPVRAFIDGGGLFTGLGADTDYGQLLALVGAESVVPETTVLRFSQLARADPDAWVLTPEAGRTKEQLRDPESPLAELRAVSEGRVFPLELGDYELSPDLPAALDALVAALHAPPEAPPIDTSTEPTETVETTTGPDGTTDG